MEDDLCRFIKPQPIRQQFNPEFQANPRKKSKSCSHFLLKFLLIALFLCLIPLFPANPPEFISQTVFAKSWELVHLLVIGIALSYGLFCHRRIPEQISSPKSQISQQRNPNVVLHHSSIFDYGDENPSGNFNKNVLGDKSCDFSYYRTEPYVVVRKENGEKVVERSLGLPVRSLRSRVVESESEDECVSEGESDSSGESSCSSVTRSGKGGNLEGNVGGVVDRNGWKSRSMREGFTAGNCDSELYSGKGENFEGNVRGVAFTNGWNSRSMREGFMEGNVDFGLHCRKGENLGVNMGSNASPNGWNSRSMRAGYMAGNGEFGLHGGNFEGNVGCNVSPNGWDSRSRRADYMADIGNVDLASGKGENLDGSVGNSSPIEWKSQFTRADFLVNSGKFGSELSKSRSFRSPAEGGASCGMNAGFCSWLPPESPNLVEGNSWGGLNCTMPLPNFHNQVSDSNLVSSSPNLGNGIADTTFFVPSTPSPPSMTVDYASGSRLYNYDSCSWGVSPNLQNGSLCVENSSFYMPSSAVPPFTASAGAPAFTASAVAPPSMPSAGAPQFIPPAAAPPLMPSSAAAPFMQAPGDNSGSSVKESRQSRMDHSAPLKKDKLKLEADNVGCFSKANDQVSLCSPSKDVAQPIIDSSLKKDEDFLIPQTPEILPSISGPSASVASSVRASRRSKLNRRLSVNKDEQKLEKDIDVVKFAQGDNSTAPPVYNPVSMATPMDGETSPMNGSLSKRDVDFFKPMAPSNDDNSLDNGSLMKNKDLVMPQGGRLPSTPSAANESAPSVKTPRSARLKNGPLLKKNEAAVPTSEPDVASSAGGSFPKKNEQRPLPMKWDEDCFVIPTLENCDREHLVEVVKEDPTPEPAYSSEVASPTDASNSRMSCDEQGLQENGVEEDVELRASTDNSKIEEFSKEIDTYRPSTPSPPPRVQIRANDDIPSSVESSSRALTIGLLNDRDDQGSPPLLKRGKSLSRSSHSRGFGCTSFFDRDLRRSFKNEAREENRNSEGDQYVGRAGKCGCLSLDVRPASSKAASKGKSVRTIKAREAVPDTNNHRDHQSVHVQQKREETEILSIKNEPERKEEKSEMVVIQIGISEKRSKSNGRKREKKQGNVGTSIIVGLSSKQNSSSKAAVLCDVKEDEPDSEIDKKADEFIAKFKEQIRLQKVAANAESSRRQHPQQNPLYQT